MSQNYESKLPDEAQSMLTEQSEAAPPRWSNYNHLTSRFQDRNSTLRRYRYLVIFVVVLTASAVGLFLSGIRPSSIRSRLQATNLSQYDGTIPATELQAQKSATVNGPQNVILSPEHPVLSSPSGEYHLRITHDGDLLLERNSSTWTPVWFSNTGRRLEGRRHLTITSQGVLHIMNAVPVEGKADSVGELWSSLALEQCIDRHNSNSSVSKSDKVAVDSQHKAASVVLDDNGRLSTSTALGGLSCVLHPGTYEKDPSSLPYDKVLLENITGKEMYWHADEFTPRELRAMLGQDLFRKNQTFDLSSRQLETIYQNAIVIASYSEHMNFLWRFLRSMIRHCIDCDRWPIHIILQSEDMQMFQDKFYAEGDESIGHLLPGLRLVEYHTLPFDLQFPKDAQVADTSNRSGSKLPIQTFKKMYGCIGTGKKYCSILDSEGIFVRTTNYADMTQEYLDDPFVIINTDGRKAGEFAMSTASADTLGLSMTTAASAGWMLEYYQWNLETSLLSTIGELIAERWPYVIQQEGWMFPEVTYYMYCYFNMGPSPSYRFINAVNLTGEQFYQDSWGRRIAEENLRQPGCRPENDMQLIEDIRRFMTWYPELLAPAAQLWNQNNLHYYKAGPNLAQAMAFLGVARSVNLCVSEQPEALYLAAMAGIFNE